MSSGAPLAAEAPPEEIRGILAPGVVPEVLRQLFLESRSGVLEIAHGADRCSLFFVDGMIADCETNLPGCHLGDILVELGFLGPRERDACMEIAALSKRGLGETLVRHSLLDQERLTQARTFMIRDALACALAWLEGGYVLVPGLPRPASGTETARAPGIDPRTILLDAIWSLEGDPILLALVGPLRQKIRRTSNARLSGLDLNLNSTDAFLLSRIDGATTIGDILQVSPVGEEQTIASLAGLICVGVAEPDESVPPRRATAEVFRSEMVRLAGRLHASDPHEVLGVKPTARTEEVRASYVDLLRICDPAAEGDSEMRPLLERMTELLMAAFRQVERVRATARPLLPELPPAPALKNVHQPRVVSGPPQPSRTPDVDPAEAMEMADEAYEQGRVHEALALLHQAIPDLDGRSRRRARVRLCQILLASENGSKLALAELKVAIEEDPGNAEAHLLSGQVYRARGAAALATAAFEKVLSLEPRNTVARAALQESGATKSQAKESAGAGSFLNKLFRR